MSADHDGNNDYDNVPQDRSRPLDLDETIRAVIYTSDTPEDLAGRVQRAIGEYSQHQRRATRLTRNRARPPDRTRCSTPR
jgi:hypothetical protein